MEVQFMLRDASKMKESVQKNSDEMMRQLQEQNMRPLFSIYVDCAGRSAHVSNTATEEASEVQAVCNQMNIPLLGFYSGVEIAPFMNKSRGLDWTGVLLIFAHENH